MNKQNKTVKIAICATKSMTGGEVVMTREDVIEALEYLISDDCTNTASEYMDEIGAAIELIKAQEPRVMTLDEVVTAKLGTVVWLEDFDKPDVISGLLKRVFIYTKVIDFLIVKEEVNNEVTADLEVYGSEWRCWTAEPTEEQRKVTPWANGITNG